MTSSTTSPLRLDPRENGPRRAANGGFACGTFAQLVGGTAKVTLRAQVPLATDLATAVGDGRAEVRAGDRRGTVLATVEAVDPFVLEPPVRPSYAEAEVARDRHPLRGVRHPLSGCVVCGPGRHDGLRVTPGPLATDDAVLAAPFHPGEGWAAGGEVRAAAVWGALDCPSYPAAALAERRFCLLGNLEAHQVRPVLPGERLVVVGWTGSAGTRSTRTFSAMIADDGSVVASARAVWVAVRHQRLVRVMARLVS
ncbi:hypothetical protein [Nocardioides sp. TF02-7]|uniref:hypothetical protein n=1 Tax=Nocardioides sp. TF02-7 TaxID=2917724 RepID=UPI001F06D4E9|nr:hypothetical protein [Nocardioides sp. TF02-7]UMG93281.1 hypothetical protein MF408_03075 [Nocardioides sp. TF02-7]